MNKKEAFDEYFHLARKWDSSSEMLRKLHYAEEQIVEAILAEHKKQIMGLTEEAVVEIGEAWKALEWQFVAEVAKREAAEHDLELLTNAALRYGPEGFDPIRCIDILVGRKATAEAERDRLRTALEKYGTHTLDCPANALSVPWGKCACGYSALSGGGAE